MLPCGGAVGDEGFTKMPSHVWIRNIIYKTTNEDLDGLHAATDNIQLPHLPWWEQRQLLRTGLLSWSWKLSWELQSTTWGSRFLEDTESINQTDQTLPTLLTKLTRNTKRMIFSALHAGLYEGISCVDLVQANAVSATRGP